MEYMDKALDGKKTSRLWYSTADLVLVIRTGFECICHTSQNVMVSQNN